MKTTFKTFIIGIISMIIPMNLSADIKVIDYAKLTPISLERMEINDADDFPKPRRSPAQNQNLPVSVYFDDTSSTILIDASQLEGSASYTLYTSNKDVVLSGTIAPKGQSTIALNGFDDEDYLIIHIEIGGVCYEGWIYL